jgi:hypothetical protein
VKERPLAALLAGTLLALAAGLTLQRIQSADYWWHLRTGQLIAETGAVPKADPYTFTVAGSPWVDIHWLFQLGLWRLYGLGGHVAVSYGRLALVGLVLALLAPIGFRRERAWLTAFALGLVLLVASDRFMPRPELASFVLLAALLLLFDRFERTGDAWVYAVLPLQLLWVNVHGLFAVGVAVCAIHLAGELALPLGQVGARPRWNRVRRLAAVTALAAACSFANPNGVDGALYPLQQLGMVGSADTRGFFGTFNYELKPPLVALPGLHLALFALLAALSAAALGLNWRRVRPADLLLWVAFFYLAMGASRNVALFALVAAPLLARNANEVLDARGLSPGASRRCSVAVALALGLLAVDAASARLDARLGRWRTPGVGADLRFLPVGAVAWIEEHRPRGPIAHHMRDGGYLIWRLYPEYRAMSDGRLEVFGPERFRDLVFDTPERLAALDRQHHFGAVIARHDVGGAHAVLAALHAQPEFRLVQVDDVAALYVRAAPGAPEPRELDLDAPGLFPPLGSGPRAVDEARLRLRAAFYVTAGRPDLALETWEAGLRLFPGLRGGDEVRALLREPGTALD